MEIYDEQLMNYDGMLVVFKWNMWIFWKHQTKHVLPQHSANLILFEGHRCFSVGVAAAASRWHIPRGASGDSTSLAPPQSLRVEMSIPIGSMYAIYGNIYHQYTPNVSIYTIHGSYGICVNFLSLQPLKVSLSSGQSLPISKRKQFLEFLAIEAQDTCITTIRNPDLWHTAWQI